MNLAETAAVARAGADLEDATFGLLGSWVPLLPEPAAKVLLAEHALHHAWHASLWRARVPDAAGLVVPSAGRDEGPLARELRVVEALAHEAFDGTSERMRAVYGVFGQLRQETYRNLLDSLSAASDGPVVRALTLILADQERDRQAGLSLRHRLRPDGGVDDRSNDEE